MILSPGERLGPYEILAAAGRGGMGEVYRARDTRLTRTVAIKVIAPAVASDPSFKMRFEREARLISALQHPRICVLHDIGHQDGLDYLVLEYIEGETLAHTPARAAPAAPGAEARHRDRRRTRGGAPPRHRPPRSQAAERHDDRGGRQARGLRPRTGRAAPGRGDVGDVDESGCLDGQGHVRRHAALHGARTNQWRRTGRADRYFRVRPGALRNGHGQEGV